MRHKIVACQRNNFQHCNATNRDNVKLFGTNVCDNTIFQCFWLGQLPVYAKCKNCNQKHTLSRDLLTKLHCDNFKHEIQNLSLKKLFLRLPSVFTASRNKRYYVSQKLQTLSTRDCTRAGYQVQICEHTTLSQFFIKCANDERKKKGGGDLRGTEVRDVCIYHKTVEPKRCNMTPSAAYQP